MKWYEDPAELTKRRREIGLSQAELAKRTGRSRSLIRDVELGRVKLRGRLAEQLWTEIANSRTEYLTTLASLRNPSLFQRTELDIFSKEARVKEQVQALQELVDTQQALLNEFASFCRDLMKEADIKDERIVSLEKKVADLREMYDVGTQATVAAARYEELREKVKAAAHKETDEAEDEKESPTQVRVDKIIRQQKEK